MKVRFADYTPQAYIIPEGYIIHHTPNGVYH